LWEMRERGSGWGAGWTRGGECSGRDDGRGGECAGRDDGRGREARRGRGG
jgi:hypothetical protein